LQENYVGIILMKILLILFLLLLPLFGAHVENFRWKSGESYLLFLKHQNLPAKELYVDLDDEDKKLTEDIRSGVNYQILYNDEDGSIEQVLIPLSDELQIHIYKKNGKYHFEAIPVIFSKKNKAFSIEIHNSPYYDILKTTHSKKIAAIFMQGFKKSLNFKTDIRKGDHLAMIYEQKYRLGKPFSMPTLQAAVVELHKKKHFIYLNEDGFYYNEKGHQVEGFLLKKPLRHARVTSRFTRRRWHPVLHKYRAHLGVDFGARRGTPIYAAGSGRVVFAGRLGGYGNVIKIRHTDGYMTLYAHQKKFKRGIHRGVYVKRGQVIGYVGSTGISTGPHLHFGLYKNGRAINPLRVVQVTTRKLKGKKLRAFKKLKENYDESLNLHLQNQTPYEKEPQFERRCYCYNPSPAQPSMSKENNATTSQDHQERTTTKR